MLSTDLTLQDSNSNTAKNQKEVNPYLDPDVGHFCAPEIEGFCETHLCIFHSSTAKKHNAQVASNSVLNIRESI